MIPRYKITADNIDVTNAIKSHFMSLRLTDKRNLEADTLDIVLNDADNQIAMPRRGVSLRVWLGYEGEALYDKGTYIVDACPLSGPPDIMTIQASSANFRDDLKIERDLSFDFVSIGWLIETIAKRNGLKAAVEVNLSLITIEHLDQTGESDANLITRLAKEYDAVATIKHGHLLFIPIGYTKSVGGINLPTVSLRRDEGDRHTFDQGDRNSRYTGVCAKWYNHDSAKTHKVVVGQEGYLRTLKETFPTEDEARANAQAEWNRIQRGKNTFSLDTAKARLDLSPNHPVVLSGWRKEITNIKWICSEIAHNLTNSGLTSNISLEEQGEND